MDRFQYQLFMPEYTGGVAAITSDQYKAINGFSNLYLGWGCEDEDFYVRIIDRGLTLIRVDPVVSIPPPLSPSVCVTTRLIVDQSLPNPASRAKLSKLVLGPGHI